MPSRVQACSRPLVPQHQPDAIHSLEDDTVLSLTGAEQHGGLRIQLERESRWWRGRVVLALGWLRLLGCLNGVSRRVHAPMASQRMELCLLSCGLLPRCAMWVRGPLHVCPPPAIGTGACRGMPSRCVSPPGGIQATCRIQAACRILSAVFKSTGRHVDARIDRHVFQERGAETCPCLGALVLPAGATKSSRALGRLLSGEKPSGSRGACHVIRQKPSVPFPNSGFHCMQKNKKTHTENRASCTLTPARPKPIATPQAGLRVQKSPRTCRCDALSEAWEPPRCAARAACPSIVAFLKIEPLAHR